MKKKWTKKRFMLNSTRLQGESLFDYQVRLCESKDDYGLSWNNIAELMGEGHSPDKYRKWWTAFEQGVQYGTAISVPDDAIVQIEDKTIQLKMERVRLQDQRREYNALIRNQARSQEIQEQITRALAHIATYKPLEFSGKFSTTSTREGLLILSDWHTGLFASNYWNYFDTNEFERRVIRLIDKTIEYSVRNRVGTLHVFSLGDLVNGLIHVSSRILATEDVVKQTMRVAEMLSEVFVYMADKFNSIKFYSCRGNHDRVTPNKSDEIASESFADIATWYMQARLSHVDNIEFVPNTFDDEIIYTEILGLKIFGVHGHRDRPSNVVQNLTLITKIVPDLVVMGHYHHHFEEEIQRGIELIINSSLSGVDTYAKEMRLTSRPAQKFLVFDEDEGKLCTYNIRLDIE